MKKYVAGFVLGIFLTSLIGTSIYIFWQTNKMTKVHELEFPLLLASEKSQNSFSLLPKGTTLYFDKAYPEGFTRYKVYINIDRMPLELKTLSDPTLIIPIDAYAPDQKSLQKLLQEYPLTKSDLEAILKSNRISKDEAREVFNKYLNE